jgi:hypothetical protein
MSSCKFLIPFSGSPSDIVGKAKNTVESNGGNFKGDDSFGMFNISAFGNTIKGNYTITGQNLEIIVEEKPFLLSCSMIESFLKSKIK